MRLRPLIFIWIISLAAAPLLGGDEIFCDSARTGADISQWHESYVPVKFFPQSSWWTVADLALLTLSLGFAARASLRMDSAKTMTVLMTGSLLYFGFLRGGCICPAGALSNAVVGLRFPELVGKSVALMFILPLAAAFFFGRVFCASACPLGALQHLVSAKHPPRLPGLVRRGMVFIPPLILAAAVVLALTEGVFLLCLLDPYRVVFAQGRALFSEAEAALFGAGAVEHTLLIAGNLTAWIIFIAALALSYFVPRIFCRLICPYGVLLGLISILGFCRPKKICGPCGDCGKCGDVCPVDAIEIPSSGGPPRVSSYLCVQCGRCLSVRGKRHRSG